MTRYTHCRLFGVDGRKKRAPAVHDSISGDGDRRAVMATAEDYLECALSDSFDDGSVQEGVYRVLLRDSKDSDWDVKVTVAHEPVVYSEWPELVAAPPTEKP